MNANEINNSEAPTTESKTIGNSERASTATVPWRFGRSVGSVNKHAKLILCAIGALVLFLMFKCWNGNCLYEFDGGVINLSNVTTIKTGMRFELKLERSGYELFSIGIDGDDVPINEDNIKKIKEEGLKKIDVGPGYTVRALAYIEFDGKRVALQEVKKGWTTKNLEETVESWLDEVETVIGKIK